ncbi:hypothetical protein LEP1GSC151_5431 [Leptospira interrogans serovar Grippotyphosa str. LT2186]|uniref:Uncharacterized protein n=1 Tax=Leptospira interrogans serovar Grippotyphosa str. LT2186 TaxID=1001599 RepID=M3GUR1_LEPIR|nr:hypothetical protein LEP1GSC151_5431 [Leptospira interrogans serovar Grippotyphosa str. LT2186]
MKISCCGIDPKPIVIQAAIYAKILLAFISGKNLKNQVL